jgi:hypothetical protein
MLRGNVLSFGRPYKKFLPRTFYVVPVVSEIIVGRIDRLSIHTTHGGKMFAVPGRCKQSASGGWLAWGFFNRINKQPFCEMFA